MKVVESTNATDSLAEYASKIANGPVIVTDHGRPVAALVPLENTDMETISLSSNTKFIELIERSRTRVRSEGALSSEQMRKRFE